MKTEFGKIDRRELADHYEAAIMHKSTLHVTWREGDGTRESRLHPYDLQAHDGREFLLANDDNGNPVRIDLSEVKAVKEFATLS